MPIDFLVRKGNEGLLEHHPYIREVLVWNKREHKTKHLIATARSVRSRKYELVVNLQRFAGSGFISAYSGARYRSGFDKNPLAITYTDRHRHVIGDGRHECERNQQLIARWTDDQPALPRLYPNDSDFAAIRRFTERPFVCIAPGSVWFTKTWPAAQWIKLIQLLLHREPELRVFLLGAPGEHTLAESIRLSSESGQVHNLAGELSFLESAALMSKAGMNYVNDSAPPPCQRNECTRHRGILFYGPGIRFWPVEHPTARDPDVPAVKLPALRHSRIPRLSERPFPMCNNHRPTGTPMTNRFSPDEEQILRKAVDVLKAAD